MNFDGSRTFWFYVHSLGFQQLAPEKWWRRETILSILLGPCLFSGAFAVSFREAITRHCQRCPLKHVETFYGPKMMSDYHLRRDEWTLLSSSPALKNPTKILPGRGKRPNYRLLKKVPTSGAAQNCRSVDWFLWGKYTYPFVPMDSVMGRKPIEDSQGNCCGFIVENPPQTMSPNSTRSGVGGQTALMYACVWSSQRGGVFGWWFGSSCSRL